MNRRRCDECMFYEEQNKEGADEEPTCTPDDRYGRCHRFPPVPAPDSTADHLDNSDCSPGFWLSPRVMATYWCGEFKKAEDALRTEPLPGETAPMVAPGVDTRRWWVHHAGSTPAAP